MHRGFIKLFRKIEEFKYYPLNRPRPFTECEAWLDLLLQANYTKKYWNGELCLRGELLYSLNWYEKRWKWSRGKVRWFFSRLKSTNSLQTKYNTKSTHLTIVNYGTYQDKQHDLQHTNSTPTTPTKERKNIIRNSAKQKKLNTIINSIYTRYCEAISFKYSDAVKPSSTATLHGWLDKRKESEIDLGLLGKAIRGWALADWTNDPKYKGPAWIFGKMCLNGKERDFMFEHIDKCESPSAQATEDFKRKERDRRAQY